MATIINDLTGPLVVNERSIDVFIICYICVYFDKNFLRITLLCDVIIPRRVPPFVALFSCLFM